jgi:DNA repair photolyase
MHELKQIYEIIHKITHTNLFYTFKKKAKCLFSNFISLKMNAMDVHEETNEENKENQVKSSWKRHEEHQYLDQIRHLINYGKTRLDRTGKNKKKKTCLEFSKMNYFFLK